MSFRTGAGVPVESSRGRRLRRAKPYLAGAAVAGACTCICLVLFPHVEVGDLILIYLIGVVAISTTFGLWPCVVTAGLSTAAFDFFFVPPYLEFEVHDLKYLVTIGVMFVVAVVMGGLTDRVRQGRELARVGERRMAVLYAISRDLSAVREPSELCAAASRHVSELFDCGLAFFLRDAGGALAESSVYGFDATDAEREAVRWAFVHGEPCGQGTAVQASLPALLLPLPGARGVVGVLCLRPSSSSLLDEPEQRNLLDTVARLIAIALESALFAKEAELAQVRLETERLRSGLLSSVSHDLRTPLSTIEGAATTMLQENARLTPEAQAELTRAIVDEARNLGRLVRNLLDMTRLESKQIVPNKERQDVEEVIGGALTRSEGRLRGRPVRTHLDDDLPLVPMDTVLVEQVLINLLENAARYTPPRSAIDVSATVSHAELRIQVADSGPGLSPGTEERVFEKFFRAESDPRGAGLGLAICRAVVVAHGGRIWAENRPAGGAVFSITLPLGEGGDARGPPSCEGS